MHPRLFQNEIHQDFSTEQDTWFAHRSSIESMFNLNHQDMNDHLMREFNKKIRDLGQPTGLYFVFNNGGLRALSPDQQISQGP